MSTHTCPDCGHTWKTGTHGGHNCVENLHNLLARHHVARLRGDDYPKAFRDETARLIPGWEHSFKLAAKEGRKKKAAAIKQPSPETLAIIQKFNT